MKDVNKNSRGKISITEYPNQVAEIFQKRSYIKVETIEEAKMIKNSMKAFIKSAKKPKKKKFKPTFSKDKK